MIMSESLLTKCEIFFVKICEHLPYDITIFEEKGFCSKKELSLRHCQYCEKMKEEYLCKKKTYTPVFQPNLPINLKNPYELHNI